MSTLIENNELRTRFNTVWASRTPVAWPNIPFTPPSPQSEWCRFSIVEGESRQTTFGATTNNFRTPGTLFVQLFDKPGAGDADILQRADEVAGIFRNWCGTNVRCRVPTIRAIGDTSDGWYQVNVSVPFVRDELL